MNKNICFFILVSIFLASCQPHYTKNETIVRAETLLDSQPDSAFRLLTSIPHPEKLAVADYAAWCLNFTHAQLKLQMEIKSDSIISVSVNYYKNSQLSRYAGTSYYLLGCVSRLNKKNEDAIEAFKLAGDILSETDENRIKGLINFNLGYICMQDELYNHSLNYFKKSLQYFDLSDNRKLQAYAYREISNMYLQLNYPFDSVMHYSNLALKLSEEAADSANYYSILSRQGELLYKRNPALSKEYILKSYRYFPLLKSEYSSFLAYTYSKLNNIDSAKHYIRIAFADTLHTNSNPLKFIAGGYVAKSQKNYKAAFENVEKAYIMRDSLFQEEIRSQLYLIDKQYDVSKKERENTQLKIANKNKVIWITLLVIIVLVISIILMLINNRHKKKQAAHELQRQEMEFEIKRKEIDNHQKRELLLAKLQNKIENTLRFNRLKIGLLQKDKYDAFIEEIKKQSIVSEHEWHHYIKEADYIFDKKLSGLSIQYPGLTTADVKVIALICFGVDISDSASLLNMNKNNLYHRRNIVKERIGVQKDIDLEAWIKENIVENK